jgi:hypothetical protein
MSKVAVYRGPRLALTVFSLLVGMMALAACGGQTPAGPVAVGPKVIGQDCGHVSIGAVAHVSSNSSAAENCLWQAWTKCQTATLVLTQFGVDTGVTHWITVQPAHGACQVTDTAQYYMVPARLNQPATTYTCAGLARSSDGGLLARDCGADRDLVIPPPTPTPTASASPA